MPGESSSPVPEYRLPAKGETVNLPKDDRVFLRNGNKLSEEELRQLYIKDRLSSVKIAKRLGAGLATIQRALRRWNIPRRNRSEAATNRKRLPGQSKKEYQALWAKRPEVIRRRHERENLPWQRRRDAIIETKGGACFVCNGHRNLKLHHLVYANGNRRQHTWITVREAETYPERFVVLCFVCHRDIHWMLRQPGRLEKFAQLIKMADGRF